MPGCGARFVLEPWQHKKVHYCPDCRDSELYQNYASHEALVRKLNVVTGLSR